MADPINYEKINGENKKTPVNANNLNHMDAQISRNAAHAKEIIVCQSDDSLENDDECTLIIGKIPVIGD